MKLRVLLTTLILMTSAALGARIPVNKKAVTKHYLNVEQGTQRGLASWYGKREQGRPMANGHSFNRNRYTCASLHYRLGTLLRVEFPKKGTWVLVTVTDRGPWVKGRILDLSEKAATTLGLKPYGVAEVTVEPVKFYGEALSLNVLQGDNEKYFTNIRFHPAGHPFYDDWGLLLCGDVSDQFNGLMNIPIAITFDAIAHDMYRGIGCHNLVYVWGIRSIQ